MNLANRALAVEFLGLPGVGKSTLSTRTAEYLSRRGYEVRELVLAISDRSALGPRLRGWSGKSYLIARELLAHPVHSFRSVRAISATGQPSLPVLLKVVANWLVQCSLLHSCRAIPAVHLFEEGIFQALWSIGLEGRPGSVRAVGGTLSAALAMPDVVAVVEADLEAVARRLETRNGRESRADRWRRDDGAAFARASALMTEVLDALTRADTGRSRVIRVENRSQADPDVAAHQLALSIEQLWLAEPSGVRTPAGQREPHPGPTA